MDHQHIYVMRCFDFHKADRLALKIGITNNLRRRIAQIEKQYRVTVDQWDCSDPIREDYARMIEKMLHRIYHRHRFGQTEWFCGRAVQYASVIELIHSIVGGICKAENQIADHMEADETLVISIDCYTEWVANRTATVVDN